MTQNKDKDSESKSGWGWGTYLIIVLWTWIGLTFIDSKVKRIDFIHRINTELKKEINKNNQEVIPNNQYTTETIIPSDTPINVNLDEPIQNEVNYQTESNESYIEDNTVSSDNNSQTESNDNSSSNTYQEPQRQKQLINCRYCNGRGIETCLNCNGNGTTKCDNCYTGTITDVVNGGRKTCYICNGTVRINCKKCYGKGNQGRCPRCGGRGQVQE
jgi:hypothetical protein